MTIFSKTILAAVLLASAAACSSSEGDTLATVPGGSTNVVQSGPQDFAEFRRIVQQGEVPAPDVLHPVGFFAEHAFDMPEATCGQSVCVHPSLAVAPRFDGTNWTMGLITMNTPVDPATLERPPAHVVVIAEPDLLGPNGFDALQSFAAELRDEDLVSFVNARSPTPIVHGQVPAPDVVDLPPATSFTDENTTLYGGLAAAEQLFDDTPMLARRVVLVTTGASGTARDQERTIGLAEAMVANATAMTVVGYGPDYQATVPQALGSLGAGTLRYVASPADLPEVLADAGRTALFPLATDFTLTLRPAAGYRIGEIHGVDRAVRDGDTVRLQLPALFIGLRDGAADVAGGRRGGGGGLFVELLPEAGATGAPGQTAFTVEATWDEDSGPQTQTTSVANELAPGAVPDGMWPSFSHPDHGKPFMVLNMYLAFRAAVDLYDAGDCSHSMGVVDMMQLSVEGWLGDRYDADIDEDWELMQRLRQNLGGKCAASTARPPVSFRGGCMFL